MRLLLPILALLPVLAFGQARAHEPEGAGSLVTAAAPIAYEEVALFDSVPGESKDAFMTRVAQGLLDFTLRSGFEGCGMLQENTQGAWRVRLTTTRSQVACLRVAFRETGWRVSNQSIHSHPPITKIFLNPVDARLIRRQPGDRIDVFPPEYSERDIDNGGGWLVVPKFRWDSARLMYRNGSQQRIVAKKLSAVAAGRPNPLPADMAYVTQSNGERSMVAVTRLP